MKDPEPGTKEWLEARKEAIGSSDAADLFQVDPYGCRRKLIYDKGLEPTDWEELPNRYMKRGTALEDVVAREGFAQKDMSVFRVLDREAIGTAEAKEIRKEHPWLKSNLDRRLKSPDDSLEGPGVGEVKTGGDSTAKPILKSHELPDHWYLQVQHQLLFTGWKWADLVFCHPNSWEFRHFLIYPDTSVTQDEMLVQGDRIWAAAMSYREGDPGQKEWILERFPRRDIKSKACASCAWHQTCHGDAWRDFVGSVDSGVADFSESPEWLSVASEWKFLKEREDDLKAEKEDLYERMKALIGDREGVIGGGIKVLWRHQESQRLDTTRLKKDHPDLAAQYLKTIKTRPFRPFLV